MLADVITPTIGSLFSGVGGLELGLELCGLGPVVWQCEREEFPRAVLNDRWPGVHVYRDVKDVDARAARPWIICGGFPCQDVSVAGSGAGIEGGERSGLWWEFRRIVRQIQPPFVFVENVFMGWRRWLPLVRRSLARIGYTALPLRVSAADVGAPHERARIFVLAYADGQHVRQLEQRMPGGRSGGVRDEGQALSRSDGARLADADGRRRGGFGLSEQGRLVSESGNIVDRRYPSGWQFPPGPAGIHAWSGPQPAVRRSVDGLSRWMDKARLQALGNAVVPFAAARAWMTLAPMVPGLVEQ